jgi:acyl carrier protein
MENRIKKVMALVFEISVNKINQESSPDTIDNWDSLKHMILVVALEEEFDIQFEEVEITEMMNYKLICNMIKGKI